MNSDELEDLVTGRLTPFKKKQFIAGTTTSRHTAKSPLFAAPFGDILDRDFHKMLAFGDRYGIATTCTTPPPPMTTAELLAHMEEVLKTIPECPIKTKMKADGFDPDDGCVLVLPEGYKEAMGPMPSYVLFSKHITVPVYARIGIDRRKQCPSGYRYVTEP